MTQRPCVVFLLYHGKSHFNASFRLAKEIQKTHHVIFAGAVFFQGYVVSQEFSFHPLNTVPFGFGFEEWVIRSRGSKRIYPNTLRARWKDSIYHERKTELDALVDNLNPEIILIDAQQATDFIPLYEYQSMGKVKLGVIHFNLPSALTESASGKWKRMWFQRLKYFGMDDETMIRRRIRRNHIPVHCFSDEKINYGCVIAGLPGIVLFPREIDYPHSFHPKGETNAKHAQRLDQHYIGFQIDYDRKELITEEYQRIKSSILRKVKSEHLKVVYCSFGTVPHTNRKKVVEFIAKITNALDSLNVAMIISAALTDEERSMIPAKTHVIDQVPQLDVLSYTDVFITHGGSNSIKESIDQQVPMLVYPVEDRIDQVGNADRISCHKLGLRGDINKETSAGVVDKVNRLTTDSDFKEHLSRMKLHGLNTDINLIDLLSQVKVNG